MTQATPQTTIDTIQARRIVTVDSAMRALIDLAMRIARLARVVLIIGETGTGKELFAHLIHAYSGRSGDFVAVNVAGLDDQLFSNTLFGHVAGAFSGATQDRAGLVQKAEGGTLFLDEFGDLSQQSQIKLLRLIQEGEFSPLGSDQVKTTDVKLVVATHQDLPKKVVEGKIREDLYFRIFGNPIHLPPLRKRRDDIEPLMKHFAANMARLHDLPASTFGQDVMDLLKAYAFPGNVRELQSMVEYALTMKNDEIHADHIHSMIEANSMLIDDIEEGEPTFVQRLRTWPTLPTLKEMGDLLFREVMRRTKENRTWAAKLLGISQPAVSQRWKKMKRKVLSS